MRGSHRLRQIHRSCILLQNTQQQQPINSFQSTKHTNPRNPYPSKKTLSSQNSRRFHGKSEYATTDSDILKRNKAITTHMRNGQCESALLVFNSMPKKDSVAYNAMISGYVNNGMFNLAKELFDTMPKRDLFSWNVMLSGYVRNKDLTGARAFFEGMPERDVVSWNSMLSGYAQNGFVDEARMVFDIMPCKNGISWKALLAMYVQNGRIDDSKRLFESKMDWEIVSWNCLMGGLVRNERLADARSLFDKMAMRDEVSWNTIITGYAQNGKMDEAQKLFTDSPIQDVFTWTAMVSGYVQNGMLHEARSIFNKMPRKDSVSWNAMIAGYVQHKRIDIAKELFEAMPCRNISSWTAMITGYAQSGDIARAKNLFDSMPQRNSISWSAMIAGYSQNGCNEEALYLFVEMQRDGGRFDKSSFSCALSACSNIAALELGMQLHCRVVKAGHLTDCCVGNALLVMYCKCGNIDEAHDAFQEILKKDVVSWNTMIYGYARHGFGAKALTVFDSMKNAGVMPDDATMVSVLSACGHAGLIDEGRKYFYSMNRDYGITPEIFHYSCMVDLLGRAGCLEEAHNLIQKMPFEPDAATWGALLGACRMHGNTELGEKAARTVFEMEPNNSGPYVLLSDLYAASRRWSDAGKVRLEMRNKGVKKVPGYSWLEFQNKVHTFKVGDTSHPDTEKIYSFLKEMDLKLKNEGYVSSTKLVFHDVEEEEKENMLKYHSEKLAVAYGILSIPVGRPIRVIQNLRVCHDCHNAIKYISKITGRLIILRDSNRFHHFNSRLCSCGDYW